MISMPISDYPASSDAVCQIQVLSERKGEISQQMQDVQDSDLPENKKRAETDRLQGSSENVSAQIRHKQSEKNYEDKLRTDQDEKQRVENKQLEKQSADSSKSKPRLDLHA